MLPWTGHVCGSYQLRDLVLFVYSAQHGRKFHWHPASDRHTVRPKFRPPYQYSQRIGDLDEVCSLQPSVI